MVILTTKKASSLIFLVALRYCPWRSNQFTCFKLRHHILKPISVNVLRWIVLLCLAIAVIGTGQTGCWQIHASVIVVCPLCSARHDEIIQLILVISAFHGIYSWWWSLIPRRAFLCPLFYYVIHIVVHVILAHLGLRHLPLYFELLRVLLRVATWIYLFELNQALILSRRIKVIAFLLEIVLRRTLIVVLT